MICPYCKSDIPDDALKCKACGEWIKPKKESETEGCFLQAMNFGCSIIGWIFVAIVVFLIILRGCHVI